MDDVIGFMKSYLREERDAYIAIWIEPDNAVVNQRGAALLGYCDHDTEPSVNRYVGLTSEELEQGRQRADELIERPIFIVKSYECEEIVPLYRFYVGSQERHVSGYYDESLFVARSGSLGWRIVSRYRACLTCYAVGMRQQTKCRDCKGKGWVHTHGLKLGSLGKVRELRRLHVPTDPFRTAFEADLGW